MIYDNIISISDCFLFFILYLCLCFSCVCHDEKSNLLYAGGNGVDDDGVSMATKEGLTAWRLLSDYPHYKQVTDYAEDLSKVTKTSTFVE